MVKPEKFDHLHLVYHFTVPLQENDFDYFTDPIFLNSLF